jgi:hypothetical protein
MAVWHFKIDLVPTLGILRIHQSIPSEIEDFKAVHPDEIDLDSPSPNYWEGIEVPEAAIEIIEGHLSPMESWSKEASMFGSDEGTRLEIWPDLFHIRIDLTKPIGGLFDLVLELAHLMDCKIIPADSGRVLDPEPAEILSACKESRAFRFLKDPEGTLRSFRKKDQKDGP